MGPGGGRQTHRRRRRVARPVGGGVMTTAPAKKTTRRAARPTRAATRPARPKKDPTEIQDASRARAAAPTSPETQQRTAEAETPFPPIEEYAFLSNCHTGALIARDGNVEWLCIPSFDSPSIFGSLLDREAGSFHFGPFGIFNPTDRDYVPGTNVLETTWRTPSGWIIVRDALTIGPRPPDDLITPHRRPPTDTDADHMLVRTVECVERSEEHTSELQSRRDLVCRLLLEKKKHKQRKEKYMGM